MFNKLKLKNCANTRKNLANDITYTYHYDNLGRLENICGYKGFDIYFTYDGSNRLTDEYYTFNGKTEVVFY